MVLCHDDMRDDAAVSPVYYAFRQRRMTRTVINVHKLSSLVVLEGHFYFVKVSWLFATYYNMGNAAVYSLQLISYYIHLIYKLRDRACGKL